MDFKLNEEQLMLKKMVRDFAQEVIAPSAAIRDEEALFDRDIFEQMGTLGLTGIIVPEQYGGAGMDYISYALVLEELSRVDASIGVTLSVHASLACGALLRFADDCLKDLYLPGLASGELLGAYALSEPNAGSDVSAMRTRADKIEGGYRLNGSKIWITSGGYADLYIVFAVTDTDAGSKGLTAFVVHKDTKGLSIGKKENKMGLRSSATTEIIFEDMFIEESHVLGQVGDGMKIALSLLDGGRMGIAAQATGIARGALDAAVDYANTRETFGKKIILHQGIGFMLADMDAQVEAAHLLTMQAAWHIDQGMPNTKLSAIAKLMAADTAMKVTTDAVQVYGGYGYTKDYPVERMMRDAKVTQIYEGTQQIQRLVISRQLM